MRHLNRYALTLASAALACGAVVAQERATPAPGAARPTGQVERAATRHLTPGDKRASTLIGATVKNRAGDDIGEIEDLIVTGRNNVATAVLTVGGVLGFGEKRIGIAYGDLEVSADGQTAYLDLTEAQLEAAPAFDYDADEAAAASTRSTPARTGTPGTAPRETQVARNEPNPARPAADAAAPERTAAAHEAPERTLKSGEQNAKALIGADVVDAGNAKVGKIRDLLVAPSGVQAVLMVGGGIASGHMVVVPFNSLKIQPADEAGREPERVQTSMTASQLEALPEFRYN